MKKRFVAPVLRAESTLGQLTLGGSCAGSVFDLCSV
jgi:hypothetical protein